MSEELHRGVNKGVNMGNNPSVEYLMKRRELLDQAIERRLLQEERFGTDEDYEKGFVFAAERNFGSSVSGQTYTYLFLKVRNDCWYSTAAFDSYGIHKKMTWEQLVDFLAHCERVDYVTAWKEI